MMLEALVACARVTLKAVATALEIELKSGEVRAEGDLDFRGPWGWIRVRLSDSLRFVCNCVGYGRRAKESG